MGLAEIAGTCVLGLLASFLKLSELLTLRPCSRLLWQLLGDNHNSTLAWLASRLTCLEAMLNHAPTAVCQRIPVCHTYENDRAALSALRLACTAGDIIRIKLIWHRFEPLRDMKYFDVYAGGLISNACASRSVEAVNMILSFISPKGLINGCEPKHSPQRGPQYGAQRAHMHRVVLSAAQTACSQGDGAIVERLISTGFVDKGDSKTLFDAAYQSREYSLAGRVLELFRADITQ